MQRSLLFALVSGSILALASVHSAIGQVIAPPPSPSPGDAAAIAPVPDPATSPCDCACDGAAPHCCCCRMPQHHPYFPSLHGYYYFRPYNYSQIAQQQAFVAGYGGDPRNPFANEVFKRVLAEYRAQSAQGPAAPKPLAP
jgi:hypothetical protein